MDKPDDPPDPPAVAVVQQDDVGVLRVHPQQQIRTLPADFDETVILDAGVNAFAFCPVLQIRSEIRHLLELLRMGDKYGMFSGVDTHDMHRLPIRPR